MLLETPGILRKSSTPCTKPFAVTNMCKNNAIVIQTAVVPKRANTLHSLKPLVEYDLGDK